MKEMPVKKYPLISVIVPSYNQGQFLNQALSSIFKQYYPRLEVIVMDGGSSDNSVEVIKSYGSKISYWQSQPDGGQAAAINAGMQRATGDLIAWLNSDDYYLKDAFKHLVKVYRKNPEASFFAGNGHRVTESGLIIEPFYKNTDIVFDRDSLIFTVDYILQPTTFMNRECLEKVNYLNPDYHFGMDWDLFIRLSEHAKPVIFFDFVAASREYADTKTASGYFRRIEELRLIAKKHSGLELTPGVMCYLIGDVLSLCEKHPKLYYGSYILEMHRLWNVNQKLIALHGLDKSGYLMQREKTIYSMLITQPVQFFQKAYVKNKNVFLWLLLRLITLLKHLLNPLLNFVGFLKRRTAKVRVSSRFLRKTTKNARELFYRCKYGFYAK